MWRWWGEENDGSHTVRFKQTLVLDDYWLCCVEFLWISGLCQSAWGPLSVGLFMCEWHNPAGHSPAVTAQTAGSPGGGCLPCTMEQSFSEHSSLWRGAPQLSWPRTRAVCRRSPSAAWCWGWSCLSLDCSGRWTAKVWQTTIGRSLTQIVPITHTMNTPTTWARRSSPLHWHASQILSQHSFPGGWQENVLPVNNPVFTSLCWMI